MKKIDTAKKVAPFECDRINVNITEPRGFKGLRYRVDITEIAGFQIY
jgi:hypothetical protein